MASTTAGSRDGTARSTIARRLQLRPSNGLPAFQPSRSEPHSGGLTLLNSNPRPLVAPLDPSRCECHRLRQSGPTSQHPPVLSGLVPPPPAPHRNPCAQQLPCSSASRSSDISNGFSSIGRARRDPPRPCFISRHSFDLPLRDRFDPLTVPAPASTSTHPPHPPRLSTTSLPRALSDRPRRTLHQVVACQS